MTTPLKPAFGYAIARRVEPGMTPGGLHVIDNAADEDATYVLVRASRGHMQEGQYIECELVPGDQLILAKHERVMHAPGAPSQLVHYYRTRKHALLPPDERMLMLCDVVASVPVERTLQ